MVEERQREGEPRSEGNTRGTDLVGVVSLLSNAAAPFYAAVAGYLRERTGLATRLVDDVPWRTRGDLLQEGDPSARVGFACGLFYARANAAAAPAAPPLELLAAPVMQAPRYAGGPVYFSDVVVARASSFASLASLRGASWAYNEPGSFSGYELVRAELDARAHRDGYFGRAVESGAHQRSLEMVAEGEVDGAAIDSHVLDLIARDLPALVARVRVVESLGPNPCPPAVASVRLPPEARATLRAALLAMDRDPDGRRVLDAGGVARFVAVTDADYDPIREAVRRAAGVRLVAGDDATTAADARERAPAPTDVHRRGSR